jgi:polysaccharide export outer membrane protein
MKLTSIFRQCFLASALVLISFSSLCFAAQNYIVGDGDVLKVTVYEHPDLTTTARVSGDGMIKFPLIGSIKVDGMSISEISMKITEILADGYIVDPHVAVFVEEFRSRKAVILGQVHKPGIYILSSNTTFLELLSKAGGLTKEAGVKTIIKRKTETAGEEKVITIDLKRLIEEGDTTLDVSLMDNDNIFISKAGVYYITGEVDEPNAYKHEEGTTVIKAIAIAGGFTDKAAPGRIKIIRKVNGKEKVVEKVKMDEPVMQEDVIVVPESFF